MSEVKNLAIPPALYDYVLYYECAAKDWVKGAKKTSVKGDGGLMNLINWNVTYSHDPNDAGGPTKFGVTKATWESFVSKHPGKGYSRVLNSMNKNSWLDVVAWYWNDLSCGGKSANYACAFTLFQMAWGGFSASNQDALLKKLRDNADNKEYKFLQTGSRYRRIADATHAYTDPMLAYDYIRKAKSTYLYNISAPGKSNNIYRCGWLTRNTLSFTPYGLYISKISYKDGGLNSNSTLDQWEGVAVKWSKENKSGYVKIMDWGATPESIEKISSSVYDLGSYGTNSSSGGVGSSSGGSYSGGPYSGCGGIYQLGNYSNAPDANIQHVQAQNREEVLNTLVGGSAITDIQKCSELITTDKKKRVVNKSNKSKDDETKNDTTKDGETKSDTTTNTTTV